MTNWLKINVVEGSQIRTGSVKGTVQSVTRDHVLLKTNGWGGQGGTSVWIPRNQIQGMYK